MFAYSLIQKPNGFFKFNITTLKKGKLSAEDPQDQVLGQKEIYLPETDRARNMQLVNVSWQ